MRKDEEENTPVDDGELVELKEVDYEGLANRARTQVTKDHTADVVG